MNGSGGKKMRNVKSVLELQMKENINDTRV